MGLLDAHLLELSKHGHTFEELVDFMKTRGVARQKPVTLPALRDCYPDIGYTEAAIRSLSDLTGTGSTFQRMCKALTGLRLARKGSTYLVRVCREARLEDRLPAGWHLFLENITHSAATPRDCDLLCTRFADLETVKLANAQGVYALDLREPRVAKRHRAVSQGADKAFEPGSEEEESEAEDVPLKQAVGLVGGNEEFVMSLFEEVHGDAGLERLEKLIQARRRGKLFDEPAPTTVKVRDRIVKVKDPAGGFIPGVGFLVSWFVGPRLDAMHEKRQELEHVRQSTDPAGGPAPVQARQKDAYQPKRHQKQWEAGAALEEQADEKYFLLYSSLNAKEFFLIFVPPDSPAYPQMNELFVQHPGVDSEKAEQFHPPQHFICVLVEASIARKLTRDDVRNAGVKMLDDSGDNLLVSCVRDVDYYIIPLAEQGVAPERVRKIYDCDYQESVQEYNRLALENLFVEDQTLDGYLNSLQTKRFAERYTETQRMEFMARTLSFEQMYPTTKQEKAAKLNARKEADKQAPTESVVKTRSGRQVKNTLGPEFLRNDNARFPELDVKKVAIAAFEPLPNAIVCLPFLPLCNRNKSETLRWTHCKDCPASAEDVISLVDPFVLAAAKNLKCARAILPHTLLGVAATRPPCHTV